MLLQMACRMVDQGCLEFGGCCLEGWRIVGRKRQQLAPRQLLGRQPLHILVCLECFRELVLALAVPARPNTPDTRVGIHTPNICLWKTRLGRPSKWLGQEETLMA